MCRDRPIPPRIRIRIRTHPHPRRRPRPRPRPRRRPAAVARRSRRRSTSCGSTPGSAATATRSSMTAATQPSIEEIVLGVLPGLPKIDGALAADRLRVRARAGRRHVHRVVLQGRARRARAVRAGRRGLDPERGDQGRGLLVRLRQRPGDRPADHHLRVDRPARAEGAGRGRDRHLRDLRRHPRDGRQPDRRDGRCPTTSGWDWKSKAGIPIVCVPGCPVQPDNFMETLLYLLYQAAGSRR